MRVDEFDYELPEELIAQHPADQRDASRMLVIDRATGRVEDHWFREIPELLQTGDLLILNNTRVFPARLFGQRVGVHAQPAPSLRNPAHHGYLQGEVEVLLARQLDHDRWEALVRPGRKLPVGERIRFGEGDATFEAEIVSRGEFGERELRFHWQGDFFQLLEKFGHMPLPPYIHRPHDQPDAVEDRERYQTVFAQQRGSVAAPTAGLHFTPAVLEALAARGVEQAQVTLDVGLGTFQPVHADEVELHVMHSEHYRIPQATAEAVRRAKREGRRVIAVGTTAVRTLESSAAAHGGEVVAEESETRLFLYPGKTFHVVDAMLTNFHAPRSTLIMLVAAFAGYETVQRAYAHAIAQRYRFLSYGDCMLIL